MWEAQFSGEPQAQFKLFELYCKGIEGELIYDYVSRTYAVRWEEEFLDLENK